MIIPHMNIVNMNIRFLAGLVTLTEYELYVDIVHHRLRIPYSNINVVTYKENSHIYLTHIQISSRHLQAKTVIYIWNAESKLYIV